MRPVGKIRQVRLKLLRGIYLRLVLFVLLIRISFTVPVEVSREWNWRSHDSKTERSWRFASLVQNISITRTSRQIHRSSQIWERRLVHFLLMNCQIQRCKNKKDNAGGGENTWNYLSLPTGIYWNYHLELPGIITSLITWNYHLDLPGVTLWNYLELPPGITWNITTWN